MHEAVDGLDGLMHTMLVLPAQFFTQVFRHMWVVELARCCDPVDPCAAHRLFCHCHRTAHPDTSLTEQEATVG